MHLDTYPVVSDPQHREYEFLSAGPKGSIKKVVRYNNVSRNIFNLSLGDWDEKIQDINDDIRSNNSDKEKVLATVATTVMEFMKHHPNATIFARGNTPAKTRLYRMGINSIWHIISQLYLVEGYADGLWQPFSRQKNYDAFSLKNK